MNSIKNRYKNPTNKSTKVNQPLPNPQLKLSQYERNVAISDVKLPDNFEELASNMDPMGCARHLVCELLQKPSFDLDEDERAILEFVK